MLRKLNKINPLVMIFRNLHMMKNNPFVFVYFFTKEKWFEKLLGEINLM